MKFGPVSLLVLLSLGTCPSCCHQSGDRGELSDPWETLVRGLRRTIVDMVLTADVARVRSCHWYIQRRHCVQIRSPAHVRKTALAESPLTVALVTRSGRLARLPHDNPCNS